MPLAWPLPSPCPPACQVPSFHRPLPVASICVAGGLSASWWFCSLPTDRLQAKWAQPEQGWNYLIILPISCSPGGRGVSGS